MTPHTCVPPRRASFFGAVAADERSRRLLSAKGAHKEICEAYASAKVLEALRAAVGVDEGDVCVLDVCSGRGIVAFTLSLLFPRARVVMFDSNRDMDLVHIHSRPNVDFVQLDVFAPTAAAVVDAATRGRRGLLLGLHVCGSLAPRVAAIAHDASTVRAFAVCPCCLKGSLGKHVKKLALDDGVAYYAKLADVLLRVCRADADDDAKARPNARPAALALHRDDHMCSPKNVFVTVVKAAPGDGSEARAASETSAPRVAAAPTCRATIR